MGYFKIENFDNTADWSTVIPPFLTVVSTDFQHLQPYDGKALSIGLQFVPALTHSEVVFSKNMEQSAAFKFPDVFEKPVLYDTLRLSYLATLGRDVTRIFKSATDFYLTVGISKDGDTLREWFFPIKENRCGYNFIDFDLKPLFDSEATTQDFDTIFFRTLRNPGDARIYFGEMYLVQEADPTHNIKLALADMLHLKKKQAMTKLAVAASAGSAKIRVLNNADIHRGTALLLEHPTSGLQELHVVSGMDMNDPTTKKRGDVTFINEFDGSKLQNSFPTNTVVYRTFPAILEELQDSEIIFPLYYIYNEAMITDEDNQNTEPVVDNYVKDDLEGNQSAIHDGLNSVTMIASINVFSDVPEVAQEMWDFLKGYVNTQSILSVAGKPYQYVVSSERDIAPDDAEALPNYVMELTFYFEHNVFERKYRPYPVFGRIAIDLGVEAVEDIP